jgi:site-specific DNA recombinase
MTRVCLYTRISTDEENQPTSLHSQHERLEAFCTAQDGWRIVTHEEDRSTGAKLDRPGLTQALDLAREGRIDLLLVYRVDRLSRKVRQLAQLAEELDRLGVVLRSATEPFDTGSAAGRMMLQISACSPSSSTPPSSTASAPASNAARKKASGRPDGSRSATAATTAKT